jgi:hypothetical protein
VPIDGGPATLIATVPAGLSNIAFDPIGGLLWATTLNPSRGLYAVSVSTGIATHVPTTNGSLNAIAFEKASGNLAACSANAGMPARALFWMEPNGVEHLLSAPGYSVL